jgi:hypothetical protein
MCDKDDIVIGIVNAVNDLTDDKSKMMVIQQICKPFAMKLLEIANAPETDTRNQKTIDMQAIEYFKKMTIIFNNLKPLENKKKHEPHILEEIFSEMWPLVERMLRKYAVSRVL